MFLQLKEKIAQYLSIMASYDKCKWTQTTKLDKLIKLK